jgi:hypothetical protein
VRQRCQRGPEREVALASLGGGQDHVGEWPISDRGLAFGPLPPHRITLPLSGCRWIVQYRGDDVDLVDAVGDVGGQPKAGEPFDDDEHGLLPVAGFEVEAAGEFVCEPGVIAVALAVNPCLEGGENPAVLREGQPRDRVDIPEGAGRPAMSRDGPEHLRTRTLPAIDFDREDATQRGSQWNDPTIQEAIPSRVTRLIRTS